MPAVVWLVHTGESKRKHAVLLEFLGSQWRSIKQELRTVRPFVWDQVRSCFTVLMLSGRMRPLPGCKADVAMLIAVGPDVEVNPRSPCTLQPAYKL